MPVLLLRGVSPHALFLSLRHSLIPVLLLVVTGSLFLSGCGRERGSDLVKEQGSESHQSAAVDNQPAPLAVAPAGAATGVAPVMPTPGVTSPGFDRGMADASGGRSLTDSAAASLGASGGRQDVLRQQLIEAPALAAHHETMQQLQVTVEGETLTLSGRVADRDVADAVVEAAHALEGITRVENELEITALAE